MLTYIFRPQTNNLILDGETLISIIYNRPEKISCNLGLNSCKVEYSNSTATLGKYKIDLNYLKSIRIDKSCVYAVSPSGELIKLAFFSGQHFYKLRAISPQTAPTVEIDGIHMHRVKDTTPWKDSYLKIKFLKIRPGAVVLDICTGLGYTAIHSLMRGAKEVISIEKDENILKLAELNPWSWKLSDHRITILLGDASEVVEYLRPFSFNYIVHDPPRISLAGELYSLEFYKKLYTLLKPKGKLFHYTGQPFEKIGYKIIKGILNRLRAAGFRRAAYISEITGIIASK
ncbi:MAG: SAM-dependent methyltransferase [Thermoprotei archaeon]|nr:MAG: SAM-dependent methyltransferase [Thermoprotei archaeon]